MSKSKFTVSMVALAIAMEVQAGGGLRHRVDALEAEVGDLNIRVEALEESPSEPKRFVLVDDTGVEVGLTPSAGSDRIKTQVYFPEHDVFVGFDVDGPSRPVLYYTLSGCQGTPYMLFSGGYVEGLYPLSVVGELNRVYTVGGLEDPPTQPPISSSDIQSFWCAHCTSPCNYTSFGPSGSYRALDYVFTLDDYVAPFGIAYR